MKDYEHKEKAIATACGDQKPSVANLDSAPAFLSHLLYVLKTDLVDESDGQIQVPADIMTALASSIGEE